MARAQNDTADGYVDPSIPNPNGSNDAPIIIYGYVYSSLHHRLFTSDFSPSNFAAPAPVIRLPLPLQF